MDKDINMTDIQRIRHVIYAMEVTQSESGLLRKNTWIQLTIIWPDFPSLDLMPPPGGNVPWANGHWIIEVEMIIYEV